MTYHDWKIRKTSPSSLCRAMPVSDPSWGGQRGVLLPKRERCAVQHDAYIHVPGAAVCMIYLYVYAYMHTFYYIYIFIQTYNYRLCNYTDMCLDTQRKARVCAEMQ